MKKRIIAFLVALSLIIVQLTPLKSFAQSLNNPFSSNDNLREKSIKISKQTEQQDTSLIRDIKLENKTKDDRQNYIVRFKEDITFNRIYDCVSRYSYTLLADSRERLFSLKIDNIASFKDTYMNIVEYVSESKKRSLGAIPDDTYYNDQWAIKNINLPDAWDITKGSTDIMVGVIDSGFYRNHEDFNSSSVLNGYNIPENKSIVNSDEIGHGTMVTSVIAAATNNKKGIAGACWNVSVIPYKVARPIDGLIYTADVIKALYMAADSGCDVINVSLGGYDMDPAEQAAVDYAVNKGCIIVAAAGNEGQSGDPYRGRLSYPASNNGVLSVASVNRYNNRSYFSQYNNKVDVCAPGEEIIVIGADGTNSYNTVSGTSFSSPYVAAVAAMARSMEQTIDAKYFEQLIKITSTDLGTVSRDDYYGWGLINAEEIVNKAVYPIICGVEDNKGYFENKTITFNKGTAKLNGNNFTSGTTITESGSYHLVVADESGNTSIVNFIIDKTPLVVNGVESGKSYNSSRTITFDKGTATLNGISIASGTVVSAEGSYILVLTGPYGNEVKYVFSIDKTPPVVKGVTDGVTYNTPVTITFNKGTATLNGNTVVSGATVYNKGSYVLIVTDSAGNTTTVRFTLTQSLSNTIEINTNTTLTQWVLDDESKTLYAISQNDKSLLFIDAHTLNVEKTLLLEGMPSDIIKDNGKLYISLYNIKKIAIVDITAREIEKTITTVSDPYRIVKDLNKIFYVTYDKKCQFREYDLDTDIDILILNELLYQPDIAVNNELNLIYLGESGSAGSRLLYYSINENRIIGKTSYWQGYGSTYPQRTTICNSKNVFYAGRAFESNNVKYLNGDYNNETVLAAMFGCVFTSTGIYNEATHVKAGNFTKPVNLIEGSDQGRLYAYDMANKKITKYEGLSGTINFDNIISIIWGMPAPKIPNTTESIQLSPDKKGLSMNSDLTEWVMDDSNNSIYAISQKDKALFFINAETLNIDHSMNFIDGPTDISIHDGDLYVALGDAYQILIIDIAAKTIKNRLFTSDDPYSIAIDGYKLFYTMYGQWRRVYEYNLITNTDKQILDSPYKPDLSVNNDQHILYIGESGLSSSKLYYYDTVENKMIGTATKSNGWGFEYPTRNVIFNGSNVLYAGHAFAPDNPMRLHGEYNKNETILAAKYGCVFTNQAIYDYASSQKLGSFRSSMNLIEVSAGGNVYCYDKMQKIIIEYQGKGSPIDKNSIVKQTEAIPEPLLPVVTESEEVDIGILALDMQSELSDWVLDEQSNTLFAISKNDKAMFLIDAKSLNVKDTVFFKGGPSNMFLDERKLYICLSNVKQIIVFDIETKSIEKTIYTAVPPESVVKDGNKLYYKYFSEIYEYNLDTDTDDLILKSTFPNLAINKELHILYIGGATSNPTTPMYLKYLNTTDNTLKVSSEAYTSLNYNTFYDGNYVFYAGCAFDPEDPNIKIGTYNSEENIILAKNGFVLTNTNMYDQFSFEWLGPLGEWYDFAELSQDLDLFLYDKTNQWIFRFEGYDDPSPEVSGVVDEGAYLDKVTITFDKGTALLDGNEFNSGDTVTTPGEHTIVVTDIETGLTTTVNFTIYTSIEGDFIPVDFNDENLYNALLYAGADSDNDGVIIRGELRILFYYLSLDGWGITDLTGLEYAVNLKELYLYDNCISDLSVISSLTELEYLDLDMNDISAINNLSSLKNLKYLYLSENQISDITPVSGLTNLRELYLSDNSISNILPLSNLINLRMLVLDNNNISNINALANLSNLGLNDDDYYGGLSVAYNKVTDITPLSGLINLSLLDLSGNQIVNITPLANLKNLSSLYLSDNNITDISPLSGLISLGIDYGELNLSGNTITNIGPLKNLKNLSSLDLGNNNIRNIDVLKNLTNLYYLSLSGNGLDNLAVLKYLTMLEYLDLSKNQIKDISVLSDLNLYCLFLNDNLIRDISPLKNLYDLSYLDLSNNRLEEIDALSDLVSLFSLNISNNEIADLSPISDLYLFELDVSLNYLDISDSSYTMQIINYFIDSDTYVIFEPQKDISLDIPPVITINPYNTKPTNQNITVTATSDKGKLNAQSHTFTSNGSFDFIATDSAGKTTKVTVTITNIDKTPPVVTGVANGNTYWGEVTIRFNEGTATIDNVPFISGNKYTVSGSHILKVTDPAGNVTTINFVIEKITLNKNTLNLYVNNNEVLIASTNSGEVNMGLIWSSSNNKVARVDSSGRVTAVSVGTAEIKAATMDGLFYAKCIVTVKAPEITLTQNSSLDIDRSAKFVLGLKQNTTFEYFKPLINPNGETVHFINPNGKMITESNYTIGTGTKVQMVNVSGSVVDQLTVVVRGDISGDGSISITDMIKLKAVLLKKDSLTGAYARAGDMNNDSDISITDFIKIKAVLLNKEKL